MDEITSRQMQTSVLLVHSFNFGESDTNGIRSVRRAGGEHAYLLLEHLQT
jgi:hypothetical protein